MVVEERGKGEVGLWVKNEKLRRRGKMKKGGREKEKFDKKNGVKCFKIASYWA